jgi:hypothetical protein
VPCCTKLVAVVQCWAPEVVQALAEGPKPFARHDWVLWPDGDEVRTGRVKDASASGTRIVVVVHDCDQTRTLSDARWTAALDTTVVAVERAMVWLDTPETEAERRRHDGMDANLIRQHMTPRKAPRAPAWKWSGRAMSNAVDPTLWVQRGWRTLSDPVCAPLVKLRNPTTRLRPTRQAGVTGMWVPERPQKRGRGTTGTQGYWRVLLMVHCLSQKVA